MPILRLMTLALALAAAAPAGAEIRFEGDARMGVVGRSATSDDGTRQTTFRVESRARLRLKARMVTDGGTTFALELDLDPALRSPDRHR